MHFFFRFALWTSARRLAESPVIAEAGQAQPVWHLALPEIHFISVTNDPPTTSEVWKCPFWNSILVPRIQIAVFSIAILDVLILYPTWFYWHTFFFSLLFSSLMTNRFPCERYHIGYRFPLKSHHSSYNGFYSAGRKRLGKLPKWRWVFLRNFIQVFTNLAPQCVQGASGMKDAGPA